jgi:hypothetical protein
MALLVPLPSPEKSGGLKGSMQHWPVVYSPEFQSPTSCVGATLVQMFKAGNRRFAASFEMSMVV